MLIRFRHVDMPALERSASEFIESFGNALPYRHVVIENFLERSTANCAASAFPPFDEMQIRYAGLVERRAMERRFDRIDPVYGAIFDELHAPDFVAWLSRLTGIADLRCDPTLNGAGLHQAGDGGQHNVHADENIFGPSGLYQRVNILIYLNDTWRAEWGGSLELWDKRMKACQTTVSPRFNRCLIMEVHDRAYHGYPAMRLPSGVTRKSITCWYYSPDPHPLQSSIRHPVIFKLRPADKLDVRIKHHVRNLSRSVRAKLARFD